jgi:hypothetical protein
MRTWDDVVFLDTVGVEGKTLSEALLAYAEEHDEHEAGLPCHCVYCQVWVPMASKLERLAASASAPERA